MKRSIFYFAVLLLIANCSGEKKSSLSTLEYFNEGELSDNIHYDSLDRKFFTTAFQQLNEISLKDNTNTHEVIRLTVSPSLIYSPYCIRIDKIDSLYDVFVKIIPDNSYPRRTGINSFSLNYSSTFERMDSIYNDLRHQMAQFDFVSQDNSTPEKLRKAEYADGTTFVLEHYLNGKHKTIVRWDGFLADSLYNKSSEFKEIIRQMHNLVPSGILPDYQNAKTVEEIRFSVFRKESD